jgi:anti-sigma factor RsiW
MATGDCTSFEFLLQADLDGELGPEGVATLAAHLADCPACQATQAALIELSARLRNELSYHAAPPRLREAIQAAAAKSTAPTSPPVQRASWLPAATNWLRLLLPVSGAAALAAALALVVIVPRGTDTTESVIASHIRALQPGHLMDVISTDQHTVKPWFNGKVDFSPPVKDLAAQGFPLIGGRLDFLAGRPVAALVYHRAKHVIDLYIWPTSSRAAAPEQAGERSGYNFVRWSQGDMVFWAVSDVEKSQLADFVRLWRSS